MKSKWFLLAALSLLAVSCMVKEPEQDAMMTDAPKITATFAANGPSTKVSLTESEDGYRQTFWEKGDEIAVFYHSGRPLEYALEGEGGESSGVFSYAGGIGGGLEFQGFYGLYPYDAKAAFDGSTMSVTFPATQNYREGAFDAKANLMVAASQTKELFFRNVGGYLVLKLYGEDVTVKKVVVRGNAGEPLAGPAEVWVTETEAPEIEVAWETAEKAVTLTCATPVKVGATEADGTEFWFVLPPTEFEEGLTVTVSDGQGGTFTRSATGWIDICRSEVYRLTTEVELEYLNGFEYVEMAPGLKIATKNVGAETPEDIGDYFAWGETSPKEEYTNDNYKYGDLHNYEPSKYTLEDGLYELEPEDDAATVNWGDGWRTPGPWIFEWLADPDNCTWTEVTLTNADGTEVNGFECVSKVPGFEGNTLFFPMSGYQGNGFNNGSELFLWTSTTDDQYDKIGAFNLYGSGSEVFVDYNWYRFCGMPVRPMYGQIPVFQIVCPKESYEITQDMYLFMEAVCLPEYADPDHLVWSSSDESIATVNEHGVVHALSLGTAVITVAAESSGVSQSCTVTVSQELSISPMGKRWLWDRTDENADFAYIDLNLFNGKYMTYIGLSDPSELTSYTDANIVGSWTCEACCMQANGAIGVTFDKHDGTTTTYLFCHPTETQADLVQVSNFDYEKGINTDYSTSEFCLPATVVTQDVPYAGGLAITLEGTDYPMWSNEEYGVSCFSIFKDDLMDGSSSATLPLAVVRQSNGDLAYGEEADFNDLDLTGKIAVLYRGGGINFITKADRAAAAGASAIIIVNNEEGSINPNMSGMTSGIPYFIIPQAAYDAILDKAEARFITTDEPITDYYLY